MIRDLKWNCLNSAKTLLFELIFAFAFRIAVIFTHVMILTLLLNHWSCLRRRLMLMSAEFVAEDSLLLCLLLIDIQYAKLIEDDQVVRLLFFFRINSCRLVSIEAIRSSCSSNQMQFMLVTFAAFLMLRRRRCKILTRFLLILSNLSFLSLWSWAVLHSCDFWVIHKEASCYKSSFALESISAWLEYREFILNRSFREDVSAFSIVLMFLICRYCYE